MTDPMLEQLCAERYGNLVAFATMLTGSRDAAQDLVHDALIAVFSRRRSFPSLNAADAYVRTAIATRYIDAGKKAANRRSSEHRFASLRSAGVPDAVPGDPDLTRVLGLLPPRVRACIVLRYLEDCSISQTAGALNLSEGSVKRYVSDGLAVLNRELGLAEALDAPPRVQVHERGDRP